ncbi:scavenger receptor cysteine-rich type 1 protein M160-like isoform X2 [Xiphophorus hellerii]|uniref:scavenger receptor cysteine-rich type 1 protein M160-like isoform X2 n=1 Tax=Xiphophorus hellerii TaxID=8084 RepID=UPI0013B41E1E|nr:scavenger receptor cysteine-rich type 1 protein M160-like isoform X2 [Xiphophorus hellerii]
MDQTALMLLLCLCSSALSDELRLVAGRSRCVGRLEKKDLGDWEPVIDWNWDLTSAAGACRQLHCGSVVSLQRDENYNVEIVCSDSVRLVQGTNRCSGRLEVRTNQSWSSVCEKDFDLQDAEVVCREISCGPPSVHQGALYGEVEATVGSREFLCEGSESALLNCSSRKSSGRNSCSPGQAVGLTCSDQDNFRLVGEASRCAGRLEMLYQEEWRPVDVYSSYWNMNSVAAVCAELDCGSAVSARDSKEASKRPVWGIWSDCFQSGSELKNCLPYDENGDRSHEIICSDSVRLVQGTNRCSGRLEVKTDQSWSSVCEKDFDLQDAEVVCREIGCGPPSVHQGALYGEAEAPVGSREFLCEGSESALLNCSSRKSSGRNSCSPGQAVGLTCSDQDNFRLVGEASRCAGRLEMLHQEEWRPVDVSSRYWDKNSAAAVCAELDCGSAVSARNSKEASKRPVWGISSDCFQSGSALKKCLPYGRHRDQSHEFICSDSVRLVQGTNRCSGRLEVKTDQSWSSVCEKDFDLQDAEVVCREIGCGPPSAHQGALYGEAEAPVGSREFLCEGSESALLNCSSRKSSGRNSCSPGQAVGLTCSDNFRLVGEASRCAGRLEMIHQEEWRPVAVWLHYWNMNSVAVVCAKLDCGSAVSARNSEEASERPVWWISSDCFQSGSALKNCLPYDENSYQSHEIICSDSVRLVQGTNRCSGRLEVKTNQSWSSVCEKDFDLQDAEVVCREISCGPPSVHQGALYGEAEAPVGSREFLCEGSESALLNCSSRKSSGRNSCSPGQAVGLTCSDNIRLVGEASRCAGRLEMLHQEEWRPVNVWDQYWDMNSAAAVCAELDCGSAVSARTSVEASERPVWGIWSDCFQSGSALKNCLPYDEIFHQSHELICSGLLVEPLIFLSSSTDGVSTGRKQGSELLIGSHFSIMCSIRPQYEGGSFQLIFSTSNYTQNQTLPAVNHSALFLSSAAGHAHHGTYRCVYHVYVFSYNFSSISQPLNLTVSVSASPTALIIRLVVVLLGMLGSVLLLYFKARRNQKSGPENNHHDEGSRAEGSLEEETAV